MTYLAIVNVALVMLVAVLAIERRRERELQVVLIQSLCQRIQAPEIAVAQHGQSVDVGYAPPAVAPDDDESHWEAKEQLAERLQEMELSNRG